MYEPNMVDEHVDSFAFKWNDLCIWVWRVLKSYGCYLR